MWSMSLDRCSPVFSVRDKNFQKVTNWSALVPEINSEQRDLWPFSLLPVALIQWNEWSKMSVYVVKGPQIVKKWHQIDDSSLLQKCQFCMLAMYKGQYHAENDCPTMKNRDLGPLGPSNLDPIYVIYVFGSMLSCILCERQKFSESHKLKRFGARNQFRAARFVTVLIIASSINTMEWVVENECVCSLGTTNSQEMTSDRWFLSSSEMSVLHASHV